MGLVRWQHRRGWLDHVAAVRCGDRGAADRLHPMLLGATIAEKTRAPKSVAAAESHGSGSWSWKLTLLLILRWLLWLMQLWRF